VYSGGDDLFVVGAWNDCLELAVDINEAFAEYTQNTLAISAGIGIFNHSYPLQRIAEITGNLEDSAKGAGKNKVALFETDNVFEWSSLKQSVIEEKFRPIIKFFKGNDERGMAMVYKILAYLYEIGDKDGEPINIARLAYLLARLEPQYIDGMDKNMFFEKKAKYATSSRNLYDWAMGDSNSRKELISALFLYVYMQRKNKKEG
jgi:CRISPR-associated protein Csm1